MPSLCSNLLLRNFTLFSTIARYSPPLFAQILILVVFAANYREQINDTIGSPTRSAYLPLRATRGGNEEEGAGIVSLPLWPKYGELASWKKSARFGPDGNSRKNIARFLNNTESAQKFNSDM